jgi:hypothetical protein
MCERDHEEAEGAGMGMQKIEVAGCMMDREPRRV